MRRGGASRGRAGSGRVAFSGVQLGQPAAGRPPGGPLFLLLFLLKLFHAHSAWARAFFALPARSCLRATWLGRPLLGA